MPNAGKTPWAVFCPIHGRVYLTRPQYDAQITKPDNRWVCTICGAVSEWDDDTYDKYLDSIGES